MRGPTAIGTALAPLDRDAAKVTVSSAKRYQRYAARCLQEARTTTDFRLKTFLVEMAQAWQRLADQAKVGGSLTNTPSSEPDRGD